MKYEFIRTPFILPDPAWWPSSSDTRGTTAIGKLILMDYQLGLSLREVEEMAFNGMIVDPPRHGLTRETKGAIRGFVKAERARRVPGVRERRPVNHHKRPASRAYDERVLFVMARRPGIDRASHG